MSTSSVNLFKTVTLGERLNRESAALARRVADVSTAADLDRLRPEIVAGARLERCELDRANAVFDVDEGASVVGVKVTIPIMGDSELLRTNPGTPGVTHPSADVEDGRGWLNEAAPSIMLSQVFPPGTTHETVRAWAKELVDQIEATLSQLNTKIDEYNDTTEIAAIKLIDERRRLLETGKNLRQDLGPGI